MVEPTHQFTLGHISYLNCVPFFATLPQQGFSGRLVRGVPSELNRMLQQGIIDGSPSSSFEYARNWRDYLLLPGHSIAATGKIASVLLFSPIPPEHLQGHSIAITGESATSINLLRVLLRTFYQHEKVTDYVPQGAVEDLVRNHQPALLIGDRALKVAASPPPGVKIYDLGELWYQHTGLPFVFALWMIRRTALTLYAQPLVDLGRQLQASRDAVLQHPELYARQAARNISLTTDQIVSYWQTIDFDLNELHIKGLELFFRLCVDCGLLRALPELEFFCK